MAQDRLFSAARACRGPRFASRKTKKPVPAIKALAGEGCQSSRPVGVVAMKAARGARLPAKEPDDDDRTPDRL